MNLILIYLFLENKAVYSHTAVPPAKASALSLHLSCSRAVGTAHGCRTASPPLCICYWASEDHGHTCGLFGLWWPILSLHGAVRSAWGADQRGCTLQCPGTGPGCKGKAWWDKRLWKVLLVVAAAAGRGGYGHRGQAISRHKGEGAPRKNHPIKISFPSSKEW